MAPPTANHNPCQHNPPTENRQSSVWTCGLPAIHTCAYPNTHTHTWRRHHNCGPCPQCCCLCLQGQAPHNEGGINVCELCQLLNHAVDLSSSSNSDRSDRQQQAQMQPPVSKCADS